ncbi:MAG: hypothetical protein AAGC55_19930, partial [Myxococcota bacterium]
TKFKAKKRAAERKLEQTRQNLLRVSDIVSELSKRLSSLRRQAQKAERYRRYRAEIRDIELWKAAHKYLEMVAENKVVTGLLATCRDDRDSARTELDSRDAAVIASRAELAVEERRLSALQESLYELENRIKLAESKIEFHTRESADLDRRVAQWAEEGAELTRRRAEAAAELAEQSTQLEAIVSESGGQDERLTMLEIQVGEARQMLTNAQADLDRARAELGRARTDLATAESRGEGLDRRRDEAQRRLDRLDSDTATTAQLAERLEREARAAERTLADLRQTRLDLGSQSEHLEARQGDLEQRTERCETEVEGLRSELALRRSRLQSLVEINQKYEGFTGGTRAVMEAADILVADGGEIRGLVADVISAPAHLETAVEAALGERLGGILVSSREVGARAIDHLKDTSAGRSSFIATDEVEAAFDPGRPNGVIPAAAEPALTDLGAPGAESDPVTVTDAARAGERAADTGERTDAADTDGAERGGVLGRLVDLVTLRPGFEHVGRALLGEFVVVGDLDSALAMQRRASESDPSAAQARALVTLAGEVIDRSGVLSGGSAGGEGASILAQKREIRELEELTADLDSRLVDAVAQATASRGELTQVVRARDALRKQTHQGELAITAHEKDASRLHGELDRVRRRLTQLGA